MNIIVTGGAGFIGSALVRNLIDETDHKVHNIDKLTYAGNLDSLASVIENDRHIFHQVDICDGEALETVFDAAQPDLVIHLAAESHVDRSIDGPADFIQTNIVGTYQLLEASRAYLRRADRDPKSFRFHHVSTDEVYGDLNETDLFTEETPYQPSSPYSASKAASDHLVRAWHRTYGLPVSLSNCSNNYGPYHFPEKLIPLMILNALEGKALPVYGDGQQIRDWLYVDDHARAIVKIATEGKVGETYNVGGFNEKANLDVVNTICALLDEAYPEKPEGVENYADLITFVTDRPGHDRRYAIDATKLERDLGWRPSETFETGIRKTIDWYLQNSDWWTRVQDGSYARERLGVMANKA